MAHNRKMLKCDCGTTLQEKETKIEHIMTKALVCPSCGFTTLTKEHAKEFRRRIHLHQVFDQERQIIKIGNSMGITLPEKLNEFGITVGKKVRIEAVDKQSFKVLIV